jgi:UDP-N-acetyl-D-mannosaminuronic acid transferase (WecB/TagA/CpsF family)
MATAHPSHPAASGLENSIAQVPVLGVPVAVCADVFAAAVALHQGGGGQIVTLNAEMTMAARADRALGAAIAEAQLVIPDGAGVVWALTAALVKASAAANTPEPKMGSIFAITGLAIARGSCAVALDLGP